MKTKATSAFKDCDIDENLSNIHDMYVVVPVAKASNNIVLICKMHFIDCLKIEYVSYCSQCNHTYTATSLSKEEIIDNLKLISPSFGLSVKDE